MDYMRSASSRASRPWLLCAIPPLVAALLGGCRDSLTPLSTDAVAGAAVHSAGANPDTLRAKEDPGRPHELSSARLARQATGFGGYAFNRAGDIVVFLTNPGDQRAVALTRSALTPLFAGWSAGMNGGRGTQRFIFRKGAHTFAQLQAWRDRISTPMLMVSGVDFVDLDEAVNRVVIGIDSRGEPGVRGAIRSRLAIWGVPESGVYIIDPEVTTMMCEPTDPTCIDPCSYDPGPNCEEPDPCAADPSAPGCGGEAADPCAVDLNSTDCTAETGNDNPCTVDPALPECGDPNYAYLVENPGADAPPPPTLLSRRRPIRAGMGVRLQGRFETDTHVYCGVGFVADFEGQRIFATAAHCSPRIAVVDGHNYYQGALNVGSDLVGYEYRDPPFSVNDFARVNIDSAGTFYNCRASTSSTEDGLLCRRSDALLARLHVSSSTFEHGTIARTVKREARAGYAGPTEINLSYPRMFISGEIGRPEMGKWLDKVGPRTGWTAGTVKRICVDRRHQDADPIYTLNPPGIAMRCQIDVAAVSDGGDSGSPVFSYTTRTNTAVLHGILRGRARGGGYSYSSMDLIRLDLGVAIGSQVLDTY